MTETRMPTQKRSIEKRDKIISKGFELMCNKGYHNVNAIDIAKYADVSTGIIYQYFNDKKDIFIEGTKKYLDDIMFPIFKYIDENETINNLHDYLFEIINKNKNQHKRNLKAHNELSSMEHLDSDVALLFKESEKTLSDKLYQLFLNNGYDKNNLEEKTHLIVILLDNLAHEEVFHEHEDFNYKMMDEIVINTIINMLNKN